ncbi:MAG TPA: hypothetical protein DCF68_21175 [Cyanothece sp. UBA12306]|nr:hypothetical protein [Cyanothece sp. UBA12306]
MHICKYENASSTVQILSFKGMERILYPGESYQFCADDQEFLRISDGNVTSIYADNIPCVELFIN